MNPWGAKGVKNCAKCGTLRLESGLRDGACDDVNWCAKQTAIPNMIAQDWVRIQEDLRSLGCAGFEVNGNKYVLYSVSGGETHTIEETDDE